MTSHLYSDAASLRHRLRQRGISLLQPWDRAMPHLSVRIHTVLNANGFTTLNDVVDNYDPEGRQFLALKNLGMTSFLELKHALEKLAGPPPSLTKRLQDLEIPLDAPWENYFHGISKEVRYILHSYGFTSVRDISSDLDLGGGRLSELLNASPGNFSELGRAIGTLAYEDDGELPGMERRDAADEPVQPGVSLCYGESLCERLEAQGVSPDRPWREVLVNLSRRAKNVLAEGNYVTLRDVALLFNDHGRALFSIANCGRKSVRGINEALETIATFGMEVYLYGTDGPEPITFNELSASAFELLSSDDRRLVIRRVIDGATLEQLGQEYALSRQGVRNRVEKKLAMLKTRLGKAARSISEPITSALIEAGGVIHRNQVEALTGEHRLSIIYFGLVIAGHETVKIWRDDYFITSGFESQLWTLRKTLRDRPDLEMPIDEIYKIAESELGLRLEGMPLIEEIVTEWGGKVLEDGRIRVGRIKLPDMVAKLLREAGKPMHFTEVARAYAAKQFDAQGPGSNGERGIGDVLTSGDGYGTSDNNIHNALFRHRDVFMCGRGTFAHISALPLAREELETAIDWCVKRLDGETKPVSTVFLLRELGDAGLADPGLNPYILKAALSRQPEILSLKKFFVGHASSLKEHGLTLNDRVEAILKESARPLSADEVISKLPRGIEYFPQSIGLCLLRAPFALSLGDGRFCHVDAVDLTPFERNALSDMVVELLPVDGTPMSCAALLKQIRLSLPQLSLIGEEYEQMILWSLLRLDERVQCGSSLLVARCSGKMTESLLLDAVVQVIKNLVVAYPRDVRREMANTFNYRQSDSNISSLIRVGVEQGLLRRLPSSLYCSIDVDEERLFGALEAIGYDLDAVSANAEVYELPLENVWLLSKYLYKAGRVTAADDLLGRLLARTPLTDELRRAATRLRTVIWSRLENQ